MDVCWSPVKCARVGGDLAKLTVWGQNERCHSVRRHGSSPAVRGPAGRRFRSGQAETLRPGASRCGIYSALIISSLVDLGLLAQNHVQQGTVDFNLAVVINKTQFPKSVHEKAHARSRRADHLRQCLWADFRYDWLRPTFLAKIRQKQKGQCQPFLARIEQLIDQDLLDTTVASQEEIDE